MYKFLLELDTNSPPGTHGLILRSLSVTESRMGPIENEDLCSSHTAPGRRERSGTGKRVWPALKPLSPHASELGPLGQEGRRAGGGEGSGSPEKALLFFPIQDETSPASTYNHHAPAKTRCSLPRPGQD